MKEKLSFKRGKDPKSAMGIGIRAKINRIINEYYKNDWGFKDEEEFDDNRILEELLCDDVGYCGVDEVMEKEFISFLINTGVDICVNNNQTLRLASAFGHFEAVKLLLDAGADVHAGDDEALLWASIKGYTKIVKLLLDAGADVRVNSVLRVASEYNHSDIVKLLLDAGAISDALKWKFHFRN